MGRKQLSQLHLSSGDTKSSYTGVHRTLAKGGCHGEKELGHFWSWSVCENLWIYTRYSEDSQICQWLFIDSKLGDLKSLLSDIQGVQSQKSMTPNAKFLRFGGWPRFDGSTQLAGWKFAFKDEAALVAFLEVMKSFGKDGLAGAQLTSLNYAQATLKMTTKSVVSVARVGQKTYRETLISYWKGCAVTGCDTRSVLKASHIKPWKIADHRERLDPFNGILLTATFDALFDSGLISFADSGAIMVAAEFTEKNLLALGINQSMKLRKVNGAHLPYLKFHRENLFKKLDLPTFFQCDNSGET